MFCPDCGSTLVYIARGSFEPKGDDRLLPKLMEESPKLMQSLQALTGDWPSKDLGVQFYACVKCKRLLMSYGVRGIYFDIVGTLSNEFVAVLVAASLGKDGQ